LPPAQVDRLESGTHHLHGLGSRERAERAHRVAISRVQLRPQSLGAESREGVLDANRATQTQNIVGLVITFDASPTGQAPLLF
jgi:hypothetical protein